MWGKPSPSGHSLVGVEHALPGRVASDDSSGEAPKDPAPKAKTRPKKHQVADDHDPIFDPKRDDEDDHDDGNGNPFEDENAADSKVPKKRPSTQGPFKRPSTKHRKHGEHEDRVSYFA